MVNSEEVEIVDESIHNSDEIQLVEEPKETELTHFRVVRNIIVKKARYTTTAVACGYRGEYKKIFAIKSSMTINRQTDQALDSQLLSQDVKIDQISTVVGQEEKYTHTHTHTHTHAPAHA